MINMVWFLVTALSAFLTAYFWLKKTYIITSSQTKKTILFDGFAEAFYFMTTVFAGFLFIFINNADFITPLKDYQFFIPLLLSGLLIVFPKYLTLILSCLAASIILPAEIVTNYLPNIDFYLAKLIVFAFLIMFSSSFSYQKTLPGVSFIELSTLGLVLFGLFYFGSAPKFYGFLGLFIGFSCFAFYLFAKTPVQIFFKKSDNLFFAFFIAILIALSSAEYLLLPCVIVFSMFFVRFLYNIAQKALSFDFKKNFDVYYLSMYQEAIDEKDLYGFIIKTYFVMGVIALSPIKAKEFLPLVAVGILFASWFLHRAYTLYAKTPTWKELYQETKESIEKAVNDKTD